MKPAPPVMKIRLPCRARGESIDALHLRPEMRIAIVIARSRSPWSAAAPGQPRRPARCRTDLKITVWPDGRAEGDAKTYTLRCGPAAGTLPKVATACSKLGPMPRPFGPVSRDAMLHRAVRRAAAGARHRHVRGALGSGRCSRRTERLPDLAREAGRVPAARTWSRSQGGARHEALEVDLARRGCRCSGSATRATRGST